VYISQSKALVRGAVYVDSETYLRLFAFQPSRPGLVDSALRDFVMPALCREPELLDAYVARQGPTELGERVIASVWSSAGGATTGETAVVAQHLAEPDNPLTAARRECYPVEIELRFPREDPARILRVFRGEVRNGMLLPYVSDVRSGAFADAEANPGLVALYLGIDPPNRFVTISAWTTWEAIEAATGGNVHRPISTSNPERIDAFDARHYEILPDALRPAPPHAIAMIGG
jgi:hypothetical protein